MQALHVYVSWLAAFRKGDQLFVSWGPTQAPQGLSGMATSWALFRGVSVCDICAAASWATPHTFVKFYRLDVSGPYVSQAVLETISTESE